MLAAVSLVLAPLSADAAPKKKPAKRAKVVCFKKSHHPPAKRKGKRVCRRAKRKPAAKKAAPVKRAPATSIAIPKTAPALVTGPAASAPAATTAETTTTTTTTTVVKPDCGTSPWVGYTAEDVAGVFRFTGKRACVPGPEVLFQVNNRDAQDHNLYAEGVIPPAPRRVIFEDVKPREVVEAAATLAPGEWRLLCTISGHGSMTRTLIVTG